MTPEQEQQLFATVDAIKVDVDKLTTDVDKLTTDVEKFNDRFSNYQQATQWVVQLAFNLKQCTTKFVKLCQPKSTRNNNNGNYDRASGRSRMKIYQL